MKKIEKTLKHLQENGSITPKEAFLKFGYYRLSDGIWKLRNRGHNIITQDETNDKGETYARYVLIDSKGAAA